MVNVKIFRIKGKMLLSHDRNPEWRPFVIEATGVKPEDVIEKVYSELGSRHKLRRRHIRIEEVKEIGPEEVTNQALRALLSLKRWIKVE